MTAPSGNAVEISNLVAAASLASHQYKPVKLNTTGQVALVAAATDKAIGILQNDPAAGAPCRIIVSGESRGIVGTSAVNEGASLGYNSTGLLVPTTTDNTWTIGVAISAAGTSSDSIRVLVHGPQRY